MDPDIQAVGVDIPLAEGGDHAQVVGVDVGEGDLHIPELRDGQQIRKQAAGEADAARADKGDLKAHKNSSCIPQILYLQYSKKSGGGGKFSPEFLYKCNKLSYNYCKRSDGSQRMRKGARLP